MAQALYFTALLSMVMCFASGEDFSIECPYPMKYAAELSNSTKIDIQCILKKNAFMAVCNGGALPSQVQFHLNNKHGSKLPWCYAYTTTCPSSGAVQSTGSSLPSSCGCVEDNGTYMISTMTIYPTLALQDGNFICEAACLTSVTLPTLVDKGGKCTNIQVVDPCGGCPAGEGCDEQSLECVKKETVEPCGGCPEGKRCNEETQECCYTAYFYCTVVFLVLTFIFLTFFIMVMVNTYKNWLELKSPLWAAWILDEILKKCGCVKTPDRTQHSGFDSTSAFTVFFRISSPEPVRMKYPISKTVFLFSIFSVCPRPMQPNTVRPEEGPSAPLSTSHRTFPVRSIKQSTAAPRLDPLDHGKTDETNPEASLSFKKLAPIPSEKKA